MGKFSGTLICSDFDGTLAHKAVIPQSNIDAIRYFQENGGLFTVISGRSAEFFDAYADEIRLDRYVGCVNGSVIWDVEKREIFEEYLIPNPKMLENFILREFHLVEGMKDVMIFGKSNFVIASVDDADFERTFSEGMAQDVHKLILHSNDDISEEEAKQIHKSFDSSYSVSLSWPRGIEIQDIKSNKGVAAKRIAELLGVRRLVCVGDYENDLSMLRVADLAYVAKEHHPMLTPFAHRVCAPCEVGTIADVIKDLEQ